jgi:acyl-CoA hydrolase
MLSRIKSLSLPIGDDLWRQESVAAQYTGPDGKLDFGLLLQKLDLDAAQIAGEQAGMPVVTIAVQGTPIRRPLALERSYLFNRYITSTLGKSLEVGIDILEDTGHSRNYVTTLYFAFAGWRDGKTAQVRQAFPETPLEKQIASAAEERKRENLAYRRGSPAVMTEDEQRALSAAMGSIKISDTTAHYLSSVKPISKNPHGYAYGGDILQLMFEHTRNHAAQFIAKQAGGTMPWPLVATINRATFDAPLRIGSQVDSEVQTIFVGDTSLVQRVVVRDETSKITNTGVFTFVARDHDNTPLHLPYQVTPQNALETALWLEALGHRAKYRNQKDVLPALHRDTRSLAWPPVYD